VGAGPAGVMAHNRVSAHGAARKRSAAHLLELYDVGVAGELHVVPDLLLHILVHLRRQGAHAGASLAAWRQRVKAAPLPQQLPLLSSTNQPLCNAAPPTLRFSMYLTATSSPVARLRISSASP
jgi:hypothetical protein